MKNKRKPNENKTPTKPTVIKDDVFADTYKCPNCGEYLQLDSCAGEKDFFCQGCGQFFLSGLRQKIDWSEDK